MLQPIILYIHGRECKEASQGTENNLVAKGKVTCEELSSCPVVCLTEGKKGVMGDKQFKKT